MTAGAAQAAVVTLLDTDGNTGADPSIAVPATGGALIAYYDRGHGDLKVARCTDTACTQATLAVLDSAGDVGDLPALAIGPDGRGVIAYADRTTPALKVAHCNDDACSSATLTVVDGWDVQGQTAIAIGVDGLPLVAYTTPAGVKVAHCSVADCTQRTVATPIPSSHTSLSLVIASNGRGLIATDSAPANPPLPPSIYRCADVACSTAPVVSGGEAQLALGGSVGPSMAVAGDGIPMFAYAGYTISPSGGTRSASMGRCTDALCTGFTPSIVLPFGTATIAGVQANGWGWFVHGEPTGQLRLRTCTNAACFPLTDTCHYTAGASEWSLATATDGKPLVPFYRTGGGLGVVYDISDPCITPRVDVGDTTAVESEGQAVFPVTLTPAVAYDLRIVTFTANDTAVAGVDYTATGGFLTFAAGTTTRSVAVPVFDDGVPEGVERFVLNVSVPDGVTIGDGQGVATLLDPPPLEVNAGDCTTIEGTTGTHGCILPVTLTRTSSQDVTVGFATASGTATAGSDYLSTSGTLTFAPGVTSQVVTVSVVGDTSVELDETFFVNLSNPSLGTVADGTGLGTILDDDAPSLSSLELTHGSSLIADLAAGPGPVASQDFYRLSQAPYASYEIVADGVSGDLAPGLVVERLAEDNATVLQAGSALGTGSAVSMRWQRRSGTTEDRQHIRVRSAGCTTDCGPDDVYRLRAYETTGRIARFNNRGSQRTILLLQNPTDAVIQGNADFWDQGGALLRTVAFTMGPRGILIVATDAVLAGQSGSITITHDGGFGAIAGKAVALEPTTGFSLDSPLAVRPR
jgi:hypothetical protein